jgi:hypothetical protein
LPELPLICGGALKKCIQVAGMINWKVVKESAHEYCRTYERARRQVHTSRKLDAANLEHHVTGLALGHRGLEHYSAVTAAQRK